MEFTPNNRAQTAAYQTVEDSQWQLLLILRYSQQPYLVTKQKSKRRYCNRSHRNTKGQSNNYEQLHANKFGDLLEMNKSLNPSKLPKLS